MNDDANKNEIEALRAEVAELRLQVKHITETNAQLLDIAAESIPAMARKQEDWERLFISHLNALKNAPELERLRERGLLPAMATLMTKFRNLEEKVDELTNRLPGAAASN